MSVVIDGTTGASLVQDGTLTAAKLAGGTGTGNLTTYTAAVQPIPTGTSLISSHSLGFVPVEAVLEFVCLTAEQNYSIGDVFTPVENWNGSILTVSGTWRSTTQCGWAVAAGQGPAMNNKTTGAAFSPTSGFWSYRFRLRAA